MKNLMLLLTWIGGGAILLAQAPDYFHYQAALRNPDGSVMKEEEVSIQVELVREQPDGPSLYLESHQATTSSLGLVTLRIGDEDFFNEIDWERGPYFLRLTVNGIPAGSTQLLSVPYALYASRTGNVEDDDADPSNEFQTLSLENSELSISDGNSVILPQATTPWKSIESDIYFGRNVGIGLFGAFGQRPAVPLDIQKNVYGDNDMALIRLKNLDEGPTASVGLAMEAYGDLDTRTFNRSELLLTSDAYNVLPDFNGMTAVRAGGKGFAVLSDSVNGSIRFYTTPQSGLLEEKIRIDSGGSLGIGTALPLTKVHIGNGDLFVEESEKGIILTSPGGNHFRITVTDSGELITTPVAL